MPETDSLEHRSRFIPIARPNILAQIRARIDAVVRGQETANVLFITGEAGIGKSTLLQMIEKECGGMSRPPIVALAECSTPLANREIGDI